MTDETSLPGKNQGPEQGKKGGAAKAARPAKKRRRIKRRHVFGAVAAFLALFIYWGTRPLTGPVEYGLCKTFIELRLEYPTTLKMTVLEGRPPLMRLFYTYQEPFGNIRSGRMDCQVEPDPETTYALTGVRFDRRVIIPPEELEEFNKTIPAILNSDIDLRLPGRSGDDLMSLKTD